MLLYRSDGLVYECIKKQERFNTHNGYSWYYKANFHVAKLWIQVFRETIETCLTTFSLGCGEMTPFFPVTGLQTCQTGFATPKAKHENKQILSVSLWSGSSHLLLGQKCSIMSKWKFSKKVDLAHHKGNLNLHIVLFRLYFVVCVYHICSVRPMAAMDTGVFFLQHMTSSHGFVRAYCPITCSNLIKNIIWIIATNKIRNIYI